MPQSTVFLASRTEEENQILKRKLELLQSDFRDLQFASLHPQGLARSVDERMAVAVINVPEWSRNEGLHLSDLRMAGYRGPVLVTAKPNGSQALATLQLMDQVTFLEKPFDAKDLVGIVKKMLTARAVAQRIHRRFATAEFAEVEFFGRGTPFSTRVSNISKGGAFLELSGLVPMHIGDMLRVRVELKEVRRTYTIPARVVWIESLGIGVEFIGTPDVKKTIFNAY